MPTMPAVFLPYSDCRTPDVSPTHTRRSSRLSVPLIRPSKIRDSMREPIQSLQRLKNRALKRHTVSFGSPASGLFNYSHANSSVYTSTPDFSAGGVANPRFARPAQSRDYAIQLHKTIEFRQRFLALPGELRNQIYDEVLFINASDPAHMRHFQPSSCRFVYPETERQTRGRALSIQSIQPQPQNLQLIREGDHIWEELMDRWMAGAEVEVFQAFDVDWTDDPCESHESLRCLKQPFLGDDAPRPRVTINLFPTAKLDVYKYRWINACTLNLSFYNVDFNFADAAADPYSSRLHTTIKDVSASLHHTIKTANVRIKVTLWPGEYLDKSFRGWAPFFESDADVEGMWTLLKPLKSVAGVQSIKVKRLKGRALWSKQPNSLYPEFPPLVIVEKSGVSIGGWLDWDRGWGAEWDWGVMAEGC